MKPYKGFRHHPDPELVNEYRTWPAERKLEWLMAGQHLRLLYPPEIIERQEKLRRGEI